MKKIGRLINEPFARAACVFMKFICYIVMLFFVAGLVLSFMGRQTFILHTSEETYNKAIYSEKSHTWTSRGPTVSMHDEVRVRVGVGEKIDFVTQAGLSAMYAVNTVPLIIAFWFLSRVFGNVSKGRIFTDRNALYLLYYGLIQMSAAVLVPFIKLLIMHLANNYAASQISIETGRNLLNNFIPNIAFIVAAYIIHYGVNLQDEADHTL